MTTFTFVFISIIEYVGVIVFMLALFRFPIVYYWPQIIFSSSICSMLSYILTVENEISFAPIIQLVVLAVCIWLMFDTPPHWSVVMCISVFSLYVVFQGGIIYFLHWVGLVPFIIHQTSISIYLIQIFCAGVCLLLAKLLTYYRMGFLFVPTNRDERIVWNDIGKWLFVGSVFAFVSLAVLYFLYTQSQFELYIILASCLAFASLLLLYILKRKNKEYVNKTWS